jgi:hypothetical protein
MSAVLQGECGLPSWHEVSLSGGIDKLLGLSVSLRYTLTRHRSRSEIASE